MLRRLFNLLAALSLAVCFAICAIWVRSFYVTDHRTIHTPAATYQVMSGGGGVVVYRLEPVDGEVRWVRSGVRWSVLGFEVIEGRFNRRRPWRLFLLPYWMPAALAAVLPGAWIAMRARRERVRPTRCPVCGTERDAGQACATCKPASTPRRANELATPTSAPPPSMPFNPKSVSYRRAV